MVSNDTFNRVFTGNAKPHTSPKALNADKTDSKDRVLAPGKTTDNTTTSTSHMPGTKLKAIKGTKAA